MSSFYPYHGPKQYSYTQEFRDYRPSTGGKAFVNTTYPGVNLPSVTHRNVLMNIKILKDGARAAEMAFLADTGIDLRSNNNAKTIFSLFNQILAAKEQTDRALKYLQQLSVEKGTTRITEKTYRDVSRFFTYYLEKSLQKHLYGTHFNVTQRTDVQLQHDIDIILGEALEQTYSSVKDFINSKGDVQVKNGSKTRSGEYVAITQMLKIIQQLKGTGIFGKFGHLFNLDRSYFESLTREGQGNIIVKKPKIDKKLDTNYGGAALELVEGALTSEIAKLNVKNSDFTFLGQSMGQQNQMKADTMILVSASGSVNIPDFLQFVNKGDDPSVRVQNIKALEEYLTKLSNKIKHVILVSDKNYSITTDFRGVSAQSAMNLKNLGNMLESFNVSQTTELINYLANCGADMIHPDGAAKIRTTLASYIGYFLFDHLEISGTAKASDINTVNVINVSGVYIPLSVYLEGLYESLKPLEANPSSLVSVSISPGGPTSGENYRPWTQGVWKKFREEHELNTTVTYHILSGIAKFITGLAQ